MIKAAKLSLALLLCLASIPATLAQTSVKNTAVGEVVRREAARKELRELLDKAFAARVRKDLVNAAKLYDAAWEKVLYIGPNVEQEAAVTKAGLAAVRLELARAAQRRGDLPEADREVKDLLRVDPENQAAIEFARANEKMIHDQRGHHPSKETLDEVPAIVENRIKASTLVQDAKVYYEMRRLNEADAKLKEAIKLDPANQPAYYYLNLIAEARYLESQNKRDATSRRSLVEIEDAWANPPKRELLPMPNRYARTNQIYTSLGRQNIMRKLDTIRIDKVKYEGLPLSEVINLLHDQAKIRDPEKIGVNFMLSSRADSGGGGGAPGAPAGAIDPATGLPATAAAPPAEGQDIGAIQVKLAPEMNDMRLMDVLDAIAIVAEPAPGTAGIKWSVNDYAVVISWKEREAQQLFLRTFRVDPNTFVQGLESVAGFAFGTGTGVSGGSGGQGGGGGSRGGQSGGQQGGQGGQGGGITGTTVPRVNLAGGTQQGQQGGQGGSGIHGVTRTNDLAAVSAGVRQYFLTLGVDLNAPKNVFWNDRQGTLLVRATMQDLDIIEAAVEALNIAPPQITIKAKFVEVSQNDTRALGFDWYLGNVLMNNGSMGLIGGTAPSYTGSSTTANPEGTFPGSSSAGTTLPASSSDSLLTSGLRNLANAPALTTFSGILTDPQFRVVIKALEQRDGVDLLNESSVTTESGRQTQVQVVDLKTIVITADFSQNNNTTPTTGFNQPIVNSGPQLTYGTETSPFGPTLDVVPYVSADGFTIQMTIIPTITEFLGYDDPGKFVPQAQAVSSGSIGIPITAQLPLPHYRIRQVATSVTVWDGQTIVLGGLISEDVQKVKDKVPFLGDLPVLGRLFRSESSSTQKKNLSIFVTPRIIDPAGNPYHTEDEMPFAASGIPSQLPPTVTPPAPLVIPTPVVPPTPPPPSAPIPVPVPAPAPGTTPEAPAPNP